jgi:hypothetical protein
LYLADFEGVACPRSFLLLLRDAHIDRGQEASKSAKYKLHFLLGSGLAEPYYGLADEPAPPAIVGGQRLHSV